MHAHIKRQYHIIEMSCIIMLQLLEVQQILYILWDGLF